MVRFDVFCQMTTMRLRTGRWPIGPSMTKTAARAVKVLLTAGPTPGLTINIFFILFAFGEKVIDGPERATLTLIGEDVVPFCTLAYWSRTLEGLLALQLALLSASGSKYTESAAARSNRSVGSSSSEGDFCFLAMVSSLSLL